MAGPIVKGTPLPVLTGDGVAYIGETNTFINEQEFQGPELAIKGLQAQLINKGWSYRIINNGPVYSIFISTPQQTVDETFDRWEIFTESTEKSLFELPHVVTAAEAYDATISAGAPTFKQACETAALEKPSATGISANATALRIIRHLRAGVTGWQLDLVGIRRSRRVEKSQANTSFRLTADTGLKLYTKAELNLPSSVAFVAPDSPADVSDLFKWRWRKRSQRTELVGNYVEQTVELILAPWTIDAYSDTSGDLAW